MSIELDPKVIKFIEENIHLIENKEWEKVYNQNPIPIGFTDAMLAAGINPLNQGLDYIPIYFLYRSKIKFFVVPNNVEKIRFGAFELCKSLTDIIILDSVKIIEEYAFADCTNLTNITLSNNLTSIEEEVFYKCTNLRTIKLPDSLTDIKNYAFSHCENLTDIEIPANVVSIGKGVFANCTQLTELKLNQNVQQVEEILQLHTRKDWRRGSNIKKLICLDGEIDLK